MKKSINYLKKTIEKQAKKLNEKYPDPTNDGSFLSDPLWEKQMGDMQRLHNLKSAPESFTEVFAALLPTDISKSLKKQSKSRSIFDLNPYDFPMEGIKSKKVKIEMPLDDLKTVLDALLIASANHTSESHWKTLWLSAQDRIDKASRLFWTKGSSDYDHEKTLRQAAHLMGWGNPKKGKHKTLHPVKEIEMVCEYNDLIRAGVDKKLAVSQIQKNYNFSNDVQCVRRLRTLGLKKLPTYSKKIQ